MSRLASIAGDITALVLTAQRSHTTAEEVHSAVVRIMERHPHAIASPDREKALAWCRVIVLPDLPAIQSESIRARLEQVRDDIRDILNITATEMQETA